jgi:hypothetical protein
LFVNQVIIEFDLTSSLISFSKDVKIGNHEQSLQKPHR